MSKTILLVDDSKSIRAVISTVLKVAGYNVLEAENGKLALDMLTAGQHVDLIITDLNMPVMDGIEFIWKARELSALVFTPICMLTTESEQSKLEKGESVSTEAWITKPIQPAHVLKIVRGIVPP
jgi:two-component system chemotaxis response regulator CheY